MQTYLGVARVYRDDGELVVDTDSIRRDGELSGVDDFGSDYDDYDDFGEDDYDDFGEDYDDEEFGEDDYDDFGDDEEEFGEEDEDDEEFGASRGRKRRQERRRRRRDRRKRRRDCRREARSGSSGSASGKKKKKTVSWQKTVLGGSHKEDSAGAIAVIVTPSHYFVADDIAFNGSSTGATVTSIIFGDDLVWNNADGIDVSALSSNSFIRGLVKGARGRPGVPITINGTIAADGDSLKVVLYGKKPGK